MVWPFRIISLYRGIWKLLTICWLWSSWFKANRACLSLNKISSFSDRGKIPGSVHAVRKRTHKTNINKMAPITGTAIVNFLYKKGQLIIINF